MQGFNIRVVASRTGLSSHVIRVWERRYEAVKPQRTQTNRRLYSESDIEKLRLLRTATSAGHQIGRIAHLSIGELRHLVAQDAAQPEPASADRNLGPEDENSISPEASLQSCLRAIEQFDTLALERVLLQASVAFSLPVLLEQVVAPLMEKVGELWQEGTIRVAHEHAVSSAVRTFLGNLRFSQTANPFAPIAIAATPAGQVHEIGALMAAVTAAAAGWQVVYLGPNLPAQEIALAAMNKNAAAILLSLVYPRDDPFLIDELHKLHSMLTAPVTILYGGRAALSYRQIVHPTGKLLQDLAGLRRELEIIRTAPNKTA